MSDPASKLRNKRVDEENFVPPEGEGDQAFLDALEDYDIVEALDDEDEENPPQKKPSKARVNPEDEQDDTEAEDEAEGEEDDADEGKQDVIITAEEADEFAAHLQASQKEAGRKDSGLRTPGKTEILMPKRVIPDHHD